MSPRPEAASRLELAALAVAALMFTAEVIRVLLDFGLQYTDQDISLLWYAAEEYAHLHFREPFFFGQTYNPMFDVVPASWLVALGVPPWTAVPIVSAVISAMIWPLLAWMAWARRARVLAVAILTLPLLLPPTYLMIGRVANLSAGVTLVVGGVACAWLRPRRGGFFACGLLAVLGTAANPAAGLLALPGAAWAVATHGRARRFWIFAGAGGALGLLLFGAAKLSYQLRPNWVMHRTWPFAPSWEKLSDGLSHLDRHLGDVSPGHSAVLMLALVVIAALALAPRWWAVAAALVTVALSLAALASTRLHQGSPSVFYPYARMYVAMPPLLGFLLLLQADRPRPRTRTRGLALLTAALALVAAARGAHLQVTLASEIDRAVATPSIFVTPRKVDELLDECRRILARVPTGALVVHLPVDRRGDGRAYGCGTVGYGRIDTLYPEYERRTWRMFEEADRTRSELFISLVPRDPCGWLGPPATACSQVDETLGLYRIGFEPQSALAVLRRLGLRVRDF